MTCCRTGLSKTCKPRREVRFGTRHEGAEEGKLDFTSLKRVVWHECLGIVFEVFAKHARLGYKTTCGDRINRTLAPIILIKSADYEEQ